MRKREIVSVEVRTGRMPEAQQRYSLGREAVRRIADAAGATIRINGITLYDFEKIDNYLSQLAGKG